MRSKKYNNVTVVYIVFAIVSITVFLLIHYKGGNFIYNEHLEESVLTVSYQNDTELTIDVNLQEMAYYIINVEGDIQEMAYQYDSDNPSKYWSVRVKTFYNMRDYAKDLSMDTCIRDNVYYLEAVKSGMTLTEEEERLASEDARMIMKNLNGRQMGVADFTIDVLFNIEKKLHLATKYVNSLVENGYTMEELELEGSYYEELKELYIFSENEELWEKVKLGNLTVKSKED